MKNRDGKEGFNSTDLILKLYDDSLESLRNTNRMKLLLPWGVLFTAAGVVYEYNLHYYFPILIGLGSFLFIWSLGEHFQIMAMFYENQILRREINHIIKYNETSEKFPVDEITDYFSRGNALDDGVYFGVGLGFVALGILGTIDLTTDFIFGVTLTVLLKLQGFLLILSIMCLSILSGRDQISKYNSLKKRYSVPEPLPKNNGEM